MDEAKQELVRNWLTKALHDLGAARRIAADAVEPDAFLDAAIYHCQQAAEKAVKGFLVFHDQEYEMTHDIRPLVQRAAGVEPGFNAWEETAENLTPYATAYRYPGPVMEPGRLEFEQALAEADGLYRFILSLLPEEVRPGPPGGAVSNHDPAGPQAV